MRFAYCHCMADGFVPLSCRLFPYTAIADGAFSKKKKKKESIIKLLGCEVVRPTDRNI